MDDSKNHESQDDGWTHVKRGGKLKLPPKSQNFPAPDRDLTLDNLVQDFARKTSTWQRSSCRAEILRTMRLRKPDGGWQITKAICLASGSFSRDNLACRRRSMLQLAAFVDIVRTLLDSEPPELYAQDPKYTDLDLEFLGSLNIIVLKVELSAKATDVLRPLRKHIGPQTMLFEFFLGLELQAIRHLLDSGIRLCICSSLLPKISASKEIGATAGPEALHSQDEPNIRYRRTAHTDSQAKLMNEAINTRLQEEFLTYNLPPFHEDPQPFAGLMYHFRVEKEEDGIPG